MDFGKVIAEVVGELERERVRYALIGGFAMALRGVQRATMDLDFILLLDDLPRTDAVLMKFGYRRAFRSENVSHYLAAESEWGRIDILHAFRAPSMAMLGRAETIEVAAGVAVKVAQPEDIIGLKVQAMTNDVERTEQDWHDIRMLIRAARASGAFLDWKLIGDYLLLFKMEKRLGELKELYGQAD